MQITANRLLSKYGRQVNFTRYVTGTYSPETGDVVSTGTTSYVGIGHPYPYAKIEIDGTVVQQNDVQLLTYSDVEPLIDDTCVIDGDTYRLMTVGKLVAENSVIVYRLQLRK